ncbi:hypothetical protein PSACC_03321 [Paramicrosporidium saccamoebae]|uniref:Uncharacterized protein n=1 Tax=Paramicrosporidium saccamoebae TaxID=1246581 RepID=A0A2H9TGG8_9FUNG|nr:hypothetical protein PSACC_03321 [Paramicrosporidium saccamoebae]
MSLFSRYVRRLSTKPWVGRRWTKVDTNLFIRNLRQLSTESRLWASPRWTRVGFALGAACLPIAAFGTYERLSPFPEPLNVSFPLSSRYFIRRALWTDSLADKAYYLDKALQHVLSSGLGAASPQSTALVIYLSMLYMADPTPNVHNLMASHAALIHKPHIGEGVREEQARLEMAFKVAERLCDLFKECDPARAKEYAEHSLNGVVQFVLYNGRRKEELSLASDEILERYPRDFDAWKYTKDFSSDITPHKGKTLHPMVAHIIRGYISHADYVSVLDNLQSAQNAEMIPPIALLRELIVECYMKCYDDITSSALLLYLQRGISGGGWDDILVDLVKFNFLEEGENNFWDIFRSLIEQECPDRDGAIMLLRSILQRLLVIGQLRQLVRDGMDDRRLRRRFISTQLMGHFQLSVESSDIPALEIICMVFVSLSADRDYYDSMLEEFYEHTLHLDQTTLFILLQGLSSVVRIELALLILGHRYRLGGGRKLPILRRIDQLMTSLSSIKVEDRAGVTRDYDLGIFRLLRMVVVWTINFCRFTCSEGSFSLMSNENMLGLIAQTKKLANAQEWPHDVRATLNSILMCIV